MNEHDPHSPESFLLRYRPPEAPEYLLRQVEQVACQPCRRKSKTLAWIAADLVIGLVVRGGQLAIAAGVIFLLWSKGY